MFKLRKLFLTGLFLSYHCLNLAQTIPFIIPKINENSEISTLKFYISDVKFEFKDKNEFLHSKKAILIDVIDQKHNFINLPDSNYKDLESISFHLGIDSITNISGAMEGDLDPINNMYWTWQSGYINLKFEGQLDDGVKREYHLGGYSFPNYAMQAVKINFENKSNPVIYIHLDDWIHSIPDSIPFQLMTPCPKAVYLSHLFANSLSSEE